MRAACAVTSFRAFACLRNWCGTTSTSSPSTASSSSTAAIPALTVDELKAQGFEYVLIGIGADKSSGIRLEGSQRASLQVAGPSCAAATAARRSTWAQHVAVVGAGNTAMDCARAALRVPGVKDVTVIYRRSLDEIPAFREEYDEAVEDGVKFRFLTNPERFEADGSLTCRVMELGAPDEKGRRRPLATDQTVTPRRWTR